MGTSTWRYYCVRTRDIAYRSETNQVLPRHPVPRSTKLGTEQYLVGDDVTHFHGVLDGIRHPHIIIHPQHVSSGLW